MGYKLTFESDQGANEGHLFGVTIEHTGMTRDEGRQCYSWQLWARSDAGAPALLCQGDDLSSGAGDAINLPKMMCTFLSFLDAWVESFPDGENADLFPAELADAEVDWQQWAMYARMDLGSEL